MFLLGAVLNFAVGNGVVGGAFVVVSATFYALPWLRSL
jgi:hypothetical protein